MSEKIIHNADLRNIEYNLSNLSNNVSNLYNSVNIANNNIAQIANEINQTNNNFLVVFSKVEEVDTKLEKFYQEFQTFVAKDIMSKELQLAETRLVKVRQELENKFGHYEKVRKHTIGILQAVDMGLIRKETITTSTEELLLSTPGYWLAPCLVTLSAWICDDQNLANKALNEAIRRNDEKTSLFFALINRRVSRYEACEAWLKRYFAMQDPKKLEREMIIVVDAYANGMFGSDSSGECSKKMKEWMSELSEKNGFIQEQRENWKKSLRLREGKFNCNEYTYLSQYSRDWNAIEKALNSTTLHDNLLNFLKGVFEGEINISPNLKVALDDMLTNLVTNFDKEELPLRKQENYIQAIIDCDGDKDLAKKKSELSERIYDEYISFTQLLTNASMFRSEVHSSRAAQRLSIALSKSWIVEAYDDIIAENRLNVPANIQIDIDEWNGTTADGSNEQELIKDFDNHCDKKMKEEIAKIKLNTASFIKVIIGIGLGALLISNIPYAFIAWVVSIGIFAFDYWKVIKKKKAVPGIYADYKEKNVMGIKALIAEIVDFRRQYEKEDKKCEATRDYIERIVPSHYVYNNFNKNRNIII